MKDLGWANSWTNGYAPVEVKNCQKMDHKLKREEIGRSVTEYSCPICEYKYKIDSGG